MNFRIGIDGGGTTTRAVVIDEHNTALGRGEAGSSNHYSVGQEHAVANIRRAVDAALSDAQILEREVVSWGLGLAGVCSAAEQSLVRSRLERVAGVQLAVEEDAVAAWAGAFGGEAGAICIAGTGANCYGRNDAGESARADGLGPLLGDRGSGYSIGEATLRAICAADEGSGPQTALLEPVLQKLEAASVEELVQLVYRPDFKRDRVASVVPLVFAHANTGDAVAHRILSDAGDALAATTLAVMRRLHLARVAPVGGVLSQNSPLRERYEAVLRREIPDIKIEDPRYDAAIGAALLL
jgi:N-acetylglucosamine kinase